MSLITGLIAGWRRGLKAVLGMALLAPLAAFSQETGSVAGLVVSTWDGAPLPGVTVTVRGLTLATQSDPSGRFDLRNVPAGDQVLRFSKPGYASATVSEVRVIPGQVTPVNGNLRPEFYDMEEYEVTAEVFVEQTEKILLDRQQSGSLLEAIGSEQFGKLGASDAAQIVARVTGVSLVGGKYAAIRGLSDRYTRTLLNGTEVPSADPYRTSPQLDLFPSSMIDRIAVTKSFTPDQPGGAGGGVIDIITKPFPEKPFVKATIGHSYNPQSNLRKNFIAAPESSMAMLDVPSGPRTLNAELFDLTSRINKPPNAVASETPQRAAQRREAAETVSGLLRELGTTDFAAVEKTSPANTSFNLSAGETKDVFKRPLGLFAGVNYNRSFRLLPESEVARYSGLGTLQRRGEETRSNINTDYGANVNLGYRVSEYAEFGFNFMLTHSLDGEARHSTFRDLEGQPENTLEQWQLHFTEREIQNYQIRGHHELPFALESKFDWTLSLASTSQNEPNHRFMNYYITPGGLADVGNSALPVPFYPSRYYRSIDEDSFNFRADYTLPLPFMKQESSFKIGFLQSNSDRIFAEQYFGYSGQGFDVSNPNTYLNDPALLEYLAIPRGGIRTNYTWDRFVELVIGRPYSATQTITAGYPMVDLGVLSWLRLIGGVRVERTFMEINARDAGSSGLDKVDLLPSAGAVFTIVTNLNFRASYGQTVARPSFREKAPISNYLPDLDLFADGNPALEMSSISSYDARLEWFPSDNEILSAGIFYKKVERPIELYRVDLADSITWINRDAGEVRGLEFEARKALTFLSDHLKDFTLGANVALIQSETSFTPVEYQNKTNANFSTGTTRPLYDQSPYIMNFDLSYDNRRSGTAVTLGANLTGERIILTTAQGPDLYEHTPISLDAMVSQKFLTHWTVRFGVRNLLDPLYKQTYGEGFDDKFRYAYRRGRTFSLSVTADF